MNNFWLVRSLTRETLILYCLRSRRKTLNIRIYLILLIYLSFVVGDQERCFIMNVPSTGKSNAHEDMEVTQITMISPGGGVTTTYAGTGWSILRVPFG